MPKTRKKLKTGYDHAAQKIIVFTLCYYNTLFRI